VTAPADVLAARLAARGRATDGVLATRLARSAPAQSDLAPDVVIENVGDLQDGGEKLVVASTGSRFCHSVSLQGGQSQRSGLRPAR